MKSEHLIQAQIDMMKQIIKDYKVDLENTENLDHKSEIRHQIQLWEQKMYTLQWVVGH